MRRYLTSKIPHTNYCEGAIYYQAAFKRAWGADFCSRKNGGDFSEIFLEARLYEKKKKINVLVKVRFRVELNSYHHSSWEGNHHTTGNHDGTEDLNQATS